MKPLRKYQQEAVQAIFDYWAGDGGNPLVELATGTGKSLVIAEVVRRIVKQYPSMRILMLVHVRELVAQNVAELVEAWPEALPLIGVNSAGLGRRDYRHPILFGSIQSVFRNPERLGARDLVLVDECHMMPSKDEGMYRSLLDGLQKNAPDLRVAGFTATPYRLGSGRLDEGEGRIFDQIVYSYDVGCGVDDGFLAPLVARATKAEISVQGVGRRGGDFKENELAHVVDDAELVRRAVSEIVMHGADRRAWIAFCVNVDHATRVRDEIRRSGVTCEVVTGETPKAERNSIIARFKAGQIRCLTSVNVLSIGFNAPQVDMIALLRPTLSTGLYVQQLGRGTRCVGPDIQTSIVNGKADCLVLDFALNVKRLGPVDAIQIESKRKNTGEDNSVKTETVRAKACPECQTLVAISAFECSNPDCGHEWPRPEIKHEAAPDLEAVIMARNAPPQPYLDVSSVDWSEHFKPGKPSSLRVTYRVGLKTYSEWICLEHPGYAKQKADRWWAAMGGAQPPATISEALFREDELGCVVGIKAKEDGAFWRVTSHRVRLPSGHIVLVDSNYRARPEPAGNPAHQQLLSLPDTPMELVSDDEEVVF